MRKSRLIRSLQRPENVKRILSISERDENADISKIRKGYATLRFHMLPKPHMLTQGFVTGIKKEDIYWDHILIVALEKLSSKNGLFNNLEMEPGQCIIFPTDRKLYFPAAGGGLAVLAQLNLSDLPPRPNPNPSLGNPL